MKVFGPDKSFNQAKVDETRNKEKSAPASKDAARSAPRTGGGSETVAVSPAAKEIGRVKSAVKDAPDIRREKVEAIREKIEKGEYHVSSEKIAGKIIEDIIKNAK